MAEQTFERQLIGKRVMVQTLTMDRTFVGELVRVERYMYILRVKGAAMIGVHKHACAAIAPVKGGDDDTKS